MDKKLKFLLIILVLFFFIYKLSDFKHFLNEKASSINLISVSQVVDTHELIESIENARPGDKIYLADGVYYGPIIIKTNGTSSNKITLEGSRQAIIKGKDAYGIWLQANHWTIRGLTVAYSKKGVILDGANFNLLENLNITQIGEEAIHLWNSSSDNIIRNNLITYTGRTNVGFGEGIYIGSTYKFWRNGKPDFSNRNKVLNNRIGPYVTAEHIDIKEATHDGLIDGNIFDGTGMVGEHFGSSWINLKGHYYTVSNNKGKYCFGHGYRLTTIRNGGPMSGCENTILNNTCSKLNPDNECVYTYYKYCKNFIKNNILV